MPSSASPRPGRRWWRALTGVALFALAYAIANRFQLTHGVLYRWAANDPANALSNFAALAMQAASLLAAAWLLPARWFVAALAFAFASILINLGYGQTVGDTIDAPRLSWLLAEARQAGQAAGEFAAPLALSAAQALLAIVLVVAARHLLRGALGAPGRAAAVPLGFALLVAPSLLAIAGPRTASGAERNLYSLGARVALAEPPPPRAPVDLAPDSDGTPRHIVWLVDESVTHAMFAKWILPSAAPYAPVDFGEAMSMGNCSAPSNVALRSGVDVRNVGPTTDLRRTPSIWNYAKKAGYRTVLVDGQAAGAPQNLLLPPERALIDEVLSMAGGMDTDREIARWLNARLKSEQRSFIYVILRGVHFQYRDHFPAGTLPADASNVEQYQAALRHSKDRFFATIFEGVERDDVAVIYTSDHGQNLAPGALPHCSEQRVASEYRVPLLAFVPERIAHRFDNPSRRQHAHSQIFPATLEWMGYDPAQVQARYDNDLARGPAAWVRFGRGVVPLETGGRIDVEVSERRFQ